MFKCNSAKFLLLCLLACTGRLPTAETKDSPADGKGEQQLTSLFEAIIGRLPNKSDQKINGIVALDLTDKPDATDEQRVITYKRQVDAILNSQQFIDEGFFRFHQQRMLLSERQDAATIDIITPEDFDALQLELKELAKNSQDYWDILRYRHRYLALGVFGGLQELRCNTSNGSCNINIGEVKRGIINIINNVKDNVRDNRNYPYRDRCCKESQGQYTEKQPKKQHKAFCEEAKSRAHEVFNKKFCSLSSDDLPSPTQESLGNMETANNSEYDKLHVALNFYLSLYLGVRTDDWFEVEFEVEVDVLKLPIVEFNGNYFLRVKFPEDLQGIHASPFWLWTYRTSVANQHLHRARIIYSSWFCQRISPDQATTGGGTPDTTDYEAYFADNDQHAKGDANCFGCHKEVQPLANYFGKLAGASSVENDALYGLGTKFLARPEDSFDRLAGYWEDGKFYGEFRGLAGLAASLPKIGKVSECLVNSAWNIMLGSDLPQLTAEEVSDAINKFKQTGNDYRQLLKHLLLTDKATTYFTKSRAEMVAKFSDESSCSEKVDFSVVKSIIESSCTTCHNANKKGAPLFLAEDNTFLANKLQMVYRRVILDGSMPPSYVYGGVIPEQLAPEAKTSLRCYLDQEVKEAGQESPVESDPLDQSHEIVEAEQ